MSISEKESISLTDDINSNFLPMEILFDTEEIIDLSVCSNSWSSSSERKTAPKVGQPIRQLMQRYGLNKEEAIATYYDWRADL